MNSTHAKGLTSWVEVSISALCNNLTEVRRAVGDSVKIMAVIKADAYGHGAKGAAPAFVEAGADYLAVTTIEEAIELRSDGISSSVLIFSPILPDQIDCALDIDADMTICDPGMARLISEVAVKAGKTARVHVKVDTGMGRLGVMPNDAPDFVGQVSNLEGVTIAGTYTHLANATASDLSDARKQISAFSSLVEELKAKGLPTGLCHAANSAAILNLPESHFGMVRPGTILYGQYPSKHVEKKLELKDTWALKTRIVALRELPVGTSVGYGSEFCTSRPTIAAVIPVGYADGFTVVPGSIANRKTGVLRSVASSLLRSHNTPYVTIEGQRASVIGRVSMQVTSVDVTEIPGLKIGDEVVVPSRRVTTSSRLPRVYVD